jgi:prepilin-type N-terminal cleavage/methylation domain-containing protein
VKKHIHNEKGLTLIEVLATLVILGIVFVGIMNIFPQMTLFNAKTYTKLDTMNLARQEMADIKSIKILPTGESILDRITGKLNGIDYTGPNTVNEEGFYEFTKDLEDNKYKYELRLFSQPDFIGNANAPSLYKIHLIIKTAEGMLSSETYGYIEVY